MKTTAASTLGNRRFEPGERPYHRARAEQWPPQLQRYAEYASSVGILRGGLSIVVASPTRVDQTHVIAFRYGIPLVSAGQEP